MTNKTCYLRNGTSFRPASERNLDLHQALPPGNYIIKADPMTGALFFDQVEGFSNPSKLYGPVREQAGRVLTTFWDRPNSTGILLNGEKGSGKTLLARQLSIQGAEQGIPTIIINAPWKGDQFNQLVQSINQPCIILFDEFEKVYDSDDQPHVLTLLDGVFNSKKLFILTCNDKYRIDQHMHNRPGRIYYSLDYVGIEDDFIREYCDDNLRAVHHTDAIVSVSHTFQHFNFDMLKAIVEEMNRYDETPQQVLRLLNVKPQADDYGTFDITYFLNGVKMDNTVVGYITSSLDQNPLSRRQIELYAPTRLKTAPVHETITNPSNSGITAVMVHGGADDEDDGSNRIYLTQEHFHNVDPATGAFTYKYEDYLIVFARRKYKAADYYGAF
jgi:hypothetical protein